MIHVYIAHMWDFIKQCALFLVSAAAVGLAIGAIFYTALGINTYVACWAALCASLVALLTALWGRLTVTSYARAFAALFWLGALLYMAYELYDFMHQYQFFYACLALSLLLACAALWFDRFIFALAAVVIVMTVPALVFTAYSPAFLGWYFVCMLGACVLLAYGGGWHILALLSFALYLFYHPYIFTAVSTTPKKGMLLLEDAFWILGFIGALFTLIPWLYSLYNPRQRIIDAICIVMAGAYTFASMRMILRTQLRFVEQFKILRVLSASPKYTYLLMHLFFIYAAIYAVLFVVGKVVRRTAGVHNVILMLALISFTGGVAVLNRTNKIIARIAQETTVWIKKIPLIRGMVTQTK